MAIRINLRLTPESEAISEARHALDRLADVLPPGKLDDVRLVVSELVTNSVLHAGLSPDDQIRLSVEASAVSVRGKVCDPGPGFRKPSKLGRGLTSAAGGAYLLWIGSLIVGALTGTATRAFGSRSIKISLSILSIRCKPPGQMHLCLIGSFYLLRW
jgi:hypothetical protein